MWHLSSSNKQHNTNTDTHTHTHKPSFSAYIQLLVENGKAADDLFITLNGRKIYLFFDTVHLIKNVRNNLLIKKRFLFPDFNFTEFYDPV